MGNFTGFNGEDVDIRVEKDNMGHDHLHIIVNGKEMGYFHILKDRMTFFGSSVRGHHVRFTKEQTSITQDVDVLIHAHEIKLSDDERQTISNILKAYEIAISLKNDLEEKDWNQFLNLTQCLTRTKLLKPLKSTVRDTSQPSAMS